jgi:SAM-dependent methyltransferase
MATDLSERDVAVIRENIRDKYRQVAVSPAGAFRYPTGVAGLKELNYAEELWRDLPPALLDSFCGVGNPFSLGDIRPGDRVVDVGCGAGFDALAAARLVGPAGAVVGVDLTPEMLARAETHRAAAGLANVRFLAGSAEDLPVPDAWADVVLSNGVFNLVPDKARALREVYRVLKPGGRLLLADMILVAAPPPQQASRVDTWHQ